MSCRVAFGLQFHGALDGMVSAAGRVLLHELIVARDEKRLLRLQKQLPRQNQVGSPFKESPLWVILENSRQVRHRSALRRGAEAKLQEADIGHPVTRRGRLSQYSVR